MNYKVGDRVNIYHPAVKLENGVIKGIGSHGRYIIGFDNGSFCMAPEDYIELVQPNSEQTVIFVTHDDDHNKKKYIFGIDSSVHVNVGDKLYADTRYGKSIVTAVCEPFSIGINGLEQLSKVHSGNGKLKYITGRAVKSYTEEPFDVDLPF